MNAEAKAMDFELSRVAELGNELLTRLDHLREATPIAWSELNQIWMVTGHAEVLEGFSGALPLSARRLPDPAVARVPPEDRERLLPCFMNATRNWLLNMDAPEHLRLRKLLVKAFGKPIVEGLRPDVRGFIKEALDDAAGKGEIDFVAEVARKIPARTILRQLGLGDEILPKLQGWAVSLNQAGNVNVSVDGLLQIEQTLKDLRAIFGPEFEKRRKVPTNDFLSALVTANEAGDKLSEQEMFGTCDIVLIAGHDTTTNTMTLGTAALAQHPEACEYIRRHPESASNVVLELSRLVGMSNAMSRRVAKDFEWKGHQLREGQYVLLFMTAANRDPAVFANPAAIDFTRVQDMNLTFAAGAHHCIGHLLAKMQLAEFFPELVRRFDLELLDKTLDFGPTLGFRGLESLRLRLHPRQ